MWKHYKKMREQEHLQPIASRYLRHHLALWAVVILKVIIALPFLPLNLVGQICKLSGQLMITGADWCFGWALRLTGLHRLSQIVAKQHADLADVVREKNHEKMVADLQKQFKPKK